MKIAEGSLNDNLVYSSPRIYDRRRRILEEARLLIAKHGMDGFGIRELCERANVAPQTVYKAFENKERLIALAIRHYFQSYADQQRFFYPDHSLQGVLERMIASDVNMRTMPEFVGAIVSIFFSQTAQSDVRVAASYNLVRTLQPWVQSLRDGCHLRRGVTPEVIMDSICGLLFNASLEWCRGNIDDSAYMSRKVQTLLTYASGATRGAGQKEINTHLADLLGRRVLYVEIEAHVVRHTPTAMPLSQVV
jgi:AcrR family transcriptional regulator